MTPSAPSPQAQEAAKQTTTYVVFRQYTADDVAHLADDAELWEQLPGQHTVPAGNKKAAIKAATADLPATRKSGQFRAVSVGTWGEPIARQVATREVDDWG